MRSLGRSRRRAIVLAVLVLAGGAGLLGWQLARGQGSTASPPQRSRGPSRPARPAHAPPPAVARPFVERALRPLPAPVQDAAAAAVGGRALLLGGLTAAGVSTDRIVSIGASGAHLVGALPTPLHDAAAVRIGRAVYLFGGGNGREQLAAIVRIDPASGAAAVVGRLPAPSSDEAAAAVAGTAYVVGGYTGRRWLDTIVAWRPGMRARVVARLPTPLRYAAATAVGGVVVVAGGSLPNGTASRAVYLYRPRLHRLTRLGLLPAPTTHAAAVSVGGVAYVVGGRGTDVGAAAARILAIDVAGRRIRPAGRLAAAASDLAAVALGSRILVAGGREPGATVARLGELLPRLHPAGVARPLRRARREGSARNVYVHDRAGLLTGAARLARPLVYVPNSESASVDVIDPRTYRIVEHFAVGALPQHVVPAYDLRTLYVTNDLGNSLTPIDPRTGRPGIDPRTGRPGRPIPVEDPYNMYFTPDGRYAIVVAERLRRLDFRDAHTFRLRRSLRVPCVGVDHLDFSADGRYLLASCEFSGALVKVDVAEQRVVGVLHLPDGPAGMPQDVKLSPDGTRFYVADMHAGGLWEVDGARLQVLGFLRTGQGVHGLYVSRDGNLLYATNRGEGSISVISFRERRQVAKWWIPGGGSPDMGGVSADGRVLWLSGRYDGVVYAISTRTGKLLAKIPVGRGPHGLCVWPQPGRYSLGHTGVMR